MGTETHLYTFFVILFFCSCVKLNDPLMGTETIQFYGIHCMRQPYLVKLNDPLMGTETHGQ